MPQLELPGDEPIPRPLSPPHLPPLSPPPPPSLPPRPPPPPPLSPPPSPPPCPPSPPQLNDEDQDVGFKRRKPLELDIDKLFHHEQIQCGLSSSISPTPPQLKTFLACMP
ncbi:hypothetical protein BDN67DRAFT_1017156 [Paxillus ammoniavirescens]|nr:hypothetical protein BDN67DRAFT_1017156 [Paxillus ammoniavirescens]